MTRETSDKEIRQAFHAKKLRHHSLQEDTLIVEELGVKHGETRVDIAVINGCIHGYEIKSSKDTLIRFEKQLDSYRRCFEKISIVSDEKHLREITQISPDYVGLISAQKGPRGAINFSTIRRARINPEVEIQTMAHLLWKAETIELLEQLRLENKGARSNRHDLYQELCGNISPRELTAFIKQKFMLRRDWRAALQ